MTWLGTPRGVYAEGMFWQVPQCFSELTCHRSDSQRPGVAHISGSSSALTSAPRAAGFGEDGEHRFAIGTPERVF